MILSRVLLAVILLTLGGMVYWVHRDVKVLSEDVAKVGIQISGKIDSANDKLISTLQKSVAKVGKPRVPPIKHLIKPPSAACFPGS